jgi:hypothetical protein
MNITIYCWSIRPPLGMRYPPIGASDLRWWMPCVWDADLGDRFPGRDWRLYSSVEGGGRIMTDVIPGS